MSDSGGTVQNSVNNEAELNQKDDTNLAGESASQVRDTASRVSNQSKTSVSSIKLRAFALKAEAEAEATALKNKQKIQELEAKQQQAQLQMKQTIEWEKENMRIQIQLDKANALIKATQQYEAEE